MNGLPAETDNDTQNIVIPGSSAVYSLADDLSILGGVNRGFSPVAPGQSSSADPEDSINYETGLRYLGRYLNTAAIDFYSDRRRSSLRLRATYPRQYRHVSPAPGGNRVVHLYSNRSRTNRDRGL